MTRLEPGAPVARRVVSLVPSATETLFALGAGDRVVGVSVFDDFPPEVARLPKVGGMVNPSFEAIVALRPDAVVGTQGPLDLAVLDRLQGMGVRVFFPKVESVSEVRASIDSFAALMGRRDEARALQSRIDLSLARVRAAVGERPRPKVLAVFSQRPMTAAGPGSWVDEILAAAGGTNVVTRGGRYPSLAIEEVLVLAPEVVLDMTWHEGTGSLAEVLVRYPAIPAVRDHRVIVLHDSMVLRPGPRLGDAVTRIAQALHPDAGL